ncbi:MAG: cyclic nucleotide-binding domain-containing protein [Chloroflexi bacterium]|nr:cyclic nucleotide-binding domain-containing protein [Chloroflexota bacterium]
MFLDNMSVDEPNHWLVTWAYGGETFEMLRSYAEEVRYPARATIFSEGDPSDAMYLIVEGMALVTHIDENGEERTLSIVTEGQSFGEVGLLLGQPRHATIAAGLDMRLLKITPAVLQQLEKDKPGLMLTVYKTLAQTLADQWMRGAPWATKSRKVG